MGLRSWWRARRRRIDIETLWPALKEAYLEKHPEDPSGAASSARAAFTIHAADDPAWSDLPFDERAFLIMGLK